MKKAIVTPIVINAIILAIYNSWEPQDLGLGLFLLMFTYFGLPIIAVLHGIISLVFYRMDKSLPGQLRLRNLIIYLVLGIVVPLLYLIINKIYNF